MGRYSRKKVFGVLYLKESISLRKEQLNHLSANVSLGKLRSLRGNVGGGGPCKEGAAQRTRDS